MPVLLGMWKKYSSHANGSLKGLLTQGKLIICEKTLQCSVIYALPVPYHIQKFYGFIINHPTISIIILHCRWVGFRISLHLVRLVQYKLR